MPNPNEYLAKESLLALKQDKLVAGDNITIDPITNRISAQTGAGTVTDVKVDNVSVVNASGIANVDLSGKQNTLTPGTNITIQNNVISATGGTEVEANPVDPATDTLTTIDIDGTVYDIAGSGGSSVVPNPQDIPTDTLNTIKIDETVYDIAGSGGGTTVVANPSGTPTDDLETIQIGNTIYDIAGSGGGTSGGVYTETVLWEDSNGLTFYPQSPQIITLSESIDKFDLLYLDTTVNGDDTYHNTNIVSVRSLYRDGKYNGVVCIGGHQYNVPSYTVDDTTHLTLNGYASANPMVAWKVVGIKVSGNYFTPQIYSLEEREVGTWTDGKPLYQKTFDLRNVTYTNRGWNRNILGTSGISIKNFKGLIGLDNAELFAEYNYYRATNEYVTTYNMGTDLQTYPEVTSGTWHGGVVTIWYTKDSDTPGSAQYNSLGVPMVHYSTDEQIVGTWIDGKTLYQKTWDFGSNITFNSNSWTNTSILTGNINGIVEVYGSNANMTCFNGIAANCDHEYIQILQSRNASITIRYLTLQYTKSSS